MGLIYTRNTDGSLTPVKTIHVISEESGEDLNAEIKEFNQMNDLVTAYLAAADAQYTAENSDTVSIIDDYASAYDGNPDMGIEEGKRERPFGLHIESKPGTFYLQNEESGIGWSETITGTSYTIHHATPGSVSQYLIKDAEGNLLCNGRIKPTGTVRMLNFEWDAFNSRDLGGWNCDGGTVRYGKLFRGAEASKEDSYYKPRNQAVARVLGIRRQIDFRDDTESGNRTSSVFGDMVKYQRIPLEESYEDTLMLSGSHYGNAKKVFRNIFDAVLHNEPLYFNCSLGRDRTGLIAFMILALLGVSRKDIDIDYELSSFSSYLHYVYAKDNSASREDTQRMAYRTGLKSRVSYLSTFGGATLRDNVVWWFIKAGFSLAELNAFRTAMINGTPEALTADNFVQTYTITKHLTGCEISNADSSVEDGTGYTATITFVDGYNSFSSVSVTMGDTDVTTDVYADGVITIPVVTGDVVITVVAVYVPSYTNQIPISTDVDGSIFDGKGYKYNVRLNGSGDVVETNNTYITGFIPCKSGDTVRFKNMDLDTTGSVMSDVRLAFYDSSKNIITVSTGAKASSYWNAFLSKEGTEISTDNILQSIVVPTYDTPVAFARFGSYNISNKSIITVNEEIV